MAGATSEQEVRDLRRKLGVYPVYKRIDSCAAEFEAITPYMYSTYEAPSFGEAEDEAMPSDRKKIVILGGGPNRIGQGIEFDYCCVHACFALAEAGFETIMVNCNPETVSTDYDTSSSWLPRSNAKASRSSALRPMRSTLPKTANVLPS